MVQIGLDSFEKNWPKNLKDSRIGLLVHPASVNRRFEHSVEIFIKSKKIKLKALFGPQHGIYGETQDNMIEWEDFQDPFTKLPVFSLYSRTRKPEPQMLSHIDVLVIDLQDVGARYYTFIWTMENCMQACMENNKSLVILDRPNPIGGHKVEGSVLKMSFASFVGQRPLPIRHGMTMGEIGSYLKNEFYPKLDFYVIEMRGLRRDSWFDETALPWIMPSPNMPTLDTAIVYPGMCLLEGTNISEGRGTTRPFEIFGAPFINPNILVKQLRILKLPGVTFRPIYFQPTFQKHAGRICGGSQIHVINRKSFKPFKTGVAILKIIHDLYTQHFEWKQPPYEYEAEKLPIDILAGTDRLRKDIERGEGLDRMEEWWQEECEQFDKTIRKRHLIYK
ncbi:MAG: exo-beta-N-acetylmuramidase NamZ family protein [Thermodesulfovibrionales bacterium]